MNEKVAVVAYYLKNLAPGEERRDYITSEDISNYASSRSRVGEF